MLSFRVFAKLHPRRPLVARRFALPVNLLPYRCPRTGEPHPRPFTLRLKGGCEGFASLTGRSLRTGPNFSIPRRSSSPSPFAHSIEDPDPVGTVDCQPPLRRSPTFTNHCPPLP